MTSTKTILFPEIESLIKTLNFESISDERKIILQPLVDFIQKKASNGQKIRLNLICTHNSRRSHLSQVWAQTAAAHYNIKNVFCYSGGTEATAMFPVAAKTLTKQGFQIKIIAEGNNPVYAIKYAENEHPIIGFSKTFDDDFNVPQPIKVVHLLRVPKCEFPLLLKIQKPLITHLNKRKNTKKEACKLLLKCSMFSLK
jgi:arsenate reductase